MNTTGDEDDVMRQQRAYIDRVDRTIVALLRERMRLGLAVGERKRACDIPVRIEAREREVIARVREAAGGPLSPESAARIFAVVIEETAAAQARAEAEYGY
jgi:chorismate mutase